MENRSVRHEDRHHSELSLDGTRDALPRNVSANGQRSSAEFISESLLTREELRSLVQFFELLDRWDREVVQ